MRNSFIVLICIAILTFMTSCSDSSDPTNPSGETDNNSPVVEITTPAEGSTYTVGDTIEFTCSASDSEDGALSGESLVWSSDLDGQIGTGETCSVATLTAGTHQITLTVTDAKGAAGTATMSITINEAVGPGGDDNNPPVVQITAPAEGSTYTVGDTIEFAGSVSDSEDGELGGESLVWSSDLDGQLGTGGTCSTAALTAGTHTISLTGTDADGATGTNTIAITVNAAPVARSVPDTGQTTSFTETFGEDADYALNPRSYTKLDASGNELHDGAPEWDMVRDNVTGLIWEIKTMAEDIHNMSHVFFWEEARDVFIAQLNSDKFGGYDDWRLPTMKELSFMIHAEKFNPAIDTDYFPHTEPTLPYWSSTPVIVSEEHAWCLKFENGFSDGRLKSLKAFACAVRGGQ